ncbi:MAG: C40 family peptidase [Lachnospiraceae bacterium]|nr:C40 family peptidase [Lachnospiraceae bacterium]
MAGPLAPLVLSSLKFAGKQIAIEAAMNEKSRGKLIPIIASAFAAIIMMPFILIMVIAITVSSAMGTFFDDVKSFLRLEWAFSAFDSDEKTEIEEEIEAWFQSLSQEEKAMLGRSAAQMREGLISEGLVSRIDNLNVLFIDGQVHKRLAHDEITAIIDGIPDEKMKEVMLWAAERVGMPYSQALRDSGTHFDCSSFVYYAYLNVGMNISFGGVNTAAQIAKGLEIGNKTFTDLSGLMPGDLIFSSNRSDESRSRYRGITHVVMYAGNGMIIDAQSTRTGITYRRLPNYGRASLVYAARPMG